LDANTQHNGAKSSSADHITQLVVGAARTSRTLLMFGAVHFMTKSARKS
jgi:hypothetical protein